MTYIVAKGDRMKKLLVVGAVLMAFATTACGGQTAATASAEPDAAVQWQDYTSDLQSSIDQLADAKDCSGLLAQIDTAEMNNDATMDQTGHDNAQLISYIQRGGRDCWLLVVAEGHPFSRRAASDARRASRPVASRALSARSTIAASSSSPVPVIVSGNLPRPGCGPRAT